MVAKRWNKRVTVPVHSKDWRTGSAPVPTGLFFWDVDWRVDHICDVDSWRWTGTAACADSDPDEWFPHPTDDVSHLAVICAACPVKRECLSMALMHDEWGYWGGTTREERGRLLGGRKRRGGRTKPPATG